MIATADRIKANLELRGFRGDKWNNLVSGTPLVDHPTFLRDKLLDCMVREKLDFYARDDPPAEALIKEVSRFKPDLLHMNMRCKSGVLRKSKFF
jgi:hypothetical protein